jgi:pSer/pThr/pTyr-binding forkhead associated (FHA) protein
MLDAKLVIVAGADTALDYVLRLPATIGRSRDNDIELPHPLVSRRHCELVELNGRLHVRDLGSMNGTFVGNKPVTGIAPIASGQLLTIGTVTLRVIYQDQELEAAALVTDSAEVDLDGNTSFGGYYDTDAQTTQVIGRGVSIEDTVPNDQTVPVVTPKRPRKK